MAKALVTTQQADFDNPIDVSSDYELTVATSTALALQEIQGAMILAKRFPRDWATCYGRVIESCKRKSLALVAEYSFPRGGTQIKGPSVNLARAMAQCWGNIRYGLDIIRDDDEIRSVRAWAWDIETNTKISADDTFKKVVQRKNKSGTTEWIKCDERDLRELTNRRGAIAVRNCILQVLPRDLAEDAIGQCHATLKESFKDIQLEKKTLIIEFGKLGVSPEALHEFLGTDEWLADHIVELQAVLNSIRDGNSKASEIFSDKKNEPTSEPTPKGMDLSKMKSGDEATHQPVSGKLEKQSKLGLDVPE